MAETAENENLEAKARRQGWVPLEEFRGDPKNFVSAETFLEMSEHNVPVMKGTIKNMDKRMQSQEAEIHKLNTTIESLRGDFAEYVEFSRNTAEKAYQKALKELQSKQRAAAEAGDLPAFDDASKEIDDMIAQHPSVTGEKSKKGKESEQPSGGSPSHEEYMKWARAGEEYFAGWQGRNTWLNEEPEMFNYAETVDRFLMRKHGLGRSRKEHLEEIEEMVKTKFPTYFGNPARRGGSPVEGDHIGGRSGGTGKTYHDLPTDAKTQCDKFCGKDGKGTSGSAPGLTRDQYVKDYFGIRE